MTRQASHPKQRRAGTVRSVVVRLSRKLTATYRIRLGRWLPRLLLALLAPYAGQSLALPGGMAVVSGQASANTPNAQSMVITQGSQKAILNWQSFSIGAGQSVQFVQPNAAAVALNRVIGQDPTAIYGSLSANGQVFLINPAGVMFAPTAQVNVGGLVASSLAISNEDFSAGRYIFSGSGNIVTTTLAASTGTAVGTGTGGTAGSITVNNTAGNVSTGAITTTGGNKGDGGSVTLSAAGTLSAGNIASSGGTSVSGYAGRNAGAVSLTGAGISLGAVTITASGSAGLGTSQAGGNGAAVSLTSTNGITQTGAISASGGGGSSTAGAGGNAGSITVSNTTAGNVSLGALAVRTGAAVGTGAGGVAGSITVNNSGGNVTTSTLTTTGGTSGDGGSVSVTASSGTLSVGAITTSGGAVTGTANGRNAGSVSLSGAGVTTAAITAAGSNASTSGTGGNGAAVSVTSSGAISSNGAISAVAGNGVGGQPAGQGGAISLTASGGNVTLAGNVTTTNQTVAIDAGTGTYTQNTNVDVSAGSGAITVTADTVAIGTNTGNNALTTSGTLTLKAKTANRAMSLAGSSGFDVSAAEITAISTGATGPIVIGDSASTGTGTLTIGTAINLAGKTVTLNAGAISDVGVKTITASNLTLHANGQIGTGSTDGIDVAVSNLSVNTTGNANAFVRSGAVNLGASGGGSNLGNGTLDLVATGSVTQTASTGNITAGTLKVKTLSAGTANITLSNSGNDVGTLDLRARNAGDTANAAGALQYSDANGFDIAALATTGNATLSAGAAVSQSGAVAVSGLALTGTGGAYTLRHAGNAVSTLAASTGSIDYSQSGALAVGTVGVAGVATTGRAAIETTGTSANLTLNNAVASSASGDAVVLKAGSSNAAGVATGGQLINNVGTSGIQASNGRYLVYSGDPASTQEGVSGYNKRYNSDANYQPAAGSGNLFLYRVAPTLTVTVADTAATTQRVYGQANPVFSGTASGFIDGDTETSVGVTRSTAAVYNTPVGDVAVTAAAANKENYTLVLNHGSMKITPATISEVSGITANNKPVDGTTSATLNPAGAAFSGIVAGDVLNVASATASFDSPAVGANKTVTISDITLGGAAAGNYILAKRTATTRASITDLSPVAPKQPLPTDAFITATVAPEAGASATGGPLFAIVRGGDGDWGVTSVASSPTGDADATLDLGFWPLSLFDLSALPATAAGARRSLAPVGPGADAGALPLRPNAEQGDARPASSNARDVRPVL